MLVCARLRHIAATRWGEKRYLDIGHLCELGARPAEDEGKAAGEAACPSPPWGGVSRNRQRLPRQMHPELGRLGPPADEGGS